MKRLYLISALAVLVAAGAAQVITAEAVAGAALAGAAVELAGDGKRS